MKILRAEANHAGLIAPLFDQYRQFYRMSADEAGAEKFLRERMQKNESVIFVATDDAGAALGFTQLYPSFSSTVMKRLWILNDLYVVPQYRRSGVAKALMERARQWGIETGAAELMLETAVDNEKAQRLYESLGWKRDTEFLTYHLLL